VVICEADTCVPAATRSTFDVGLGLLRVESQHHRSGCPDGLDVADVEDAPAEHVDDARLVEDKLDLVGGQGRFRPGSRVQLH
jgi:hypothetical protein